MAMIDSCVRALFDNKADAVGVVTGHPLLVVMGGQRQPLGNDAVTTQQAEQLLLEILPADKLAEFKGTGTTEIVHPSPAGTVKVTARRAGGGVQIMVLPAAGAGGAARPPAEPPPATPAVAGKPAGDPAGEAVGTTRTSPPAPAQPASDEKPIDLLFREMVKRGGSDLYVCTHKRPLVRKDGEIVPIGETALSEDEVRARLFSITPEKYWQEFEQTNDVDFAYEIVGLARFRANLFRDRNGMGAVFRQIPAEILTAEQMNLPKAILDLCMLNKGLVLITGPTGSGKSTTLAAMIDYINRNRAAHIITIEDPIEFVHVDKRCVINQREVGSHTEGFKRALRAALREDPDIVLVGELRDLETVSIAIETAETGHLVFATLHTNTAASTVDRIIDQFPADQQQQIRTMLSEALKGVVSQTLCKKKNGGRAAALEILLVPHAVANLIREGKTHQIPSVMQTSKGAGMCTLNDALMDLVDKGAIASEEALNKAIDRTDMRSRLQRTGAPAPAGGGR